MNTDARPYCDHGSFKGPCSNEKHEAIKCLNPHREGYDQKGNLINPMLAFSVMLTNYVDNIRYTPDGPVCRCCRALV